MSFVTVSCDIMKTLFVALWNDIFGCPGWGFTCFFYRVPPLLKGWYGAPLELRCCARPMYIACCLIFGPLKTGYAFHLGARVFGRPLHVICFTVGP